MSEARKVILEKLKREGTETSMPSPPVYRPRHGWSLEERIDRFTEKLESVHGEVHRVQRDALPDSLAAVLKEKQVSRLLVSSKTAGLLAKTEQEREVLLYDRPVEDWKAELFASIDAALTTTLGGIAETGSLLLWPDREEPRLMSLVPPIHIALVETGRIHETFAEVVETQDWKARMPTNALLISGPSKTADIEQTLAYGIHGPKQLIVFLIDG